MPSVRDLYRKQTTELANASLEPLALPHIATPSDPGAGNTAVYAKTDGKLYTFPAGGAETEVGSGATGGGREVLTGNRTYYVRTDGNDSNDGLSDTSGGAFLTIQKAIDVAAGLDFSTYQCTIQVQPGGTFQEITAKTTIGENPLLILGDVANRPTITSSTTSAVIISNGCSLSFKGMKFTTTTGGKDCLTVFGRAIFPDDSAPEFGGWARYCILSNSGFVDFDVNEGGCNILISGGGISSTGNFSCFRFFNNAVLSGARGVYTITNTPGWGTTGAFVSASQGASVDLVVSTFTGSATGKRHDVVQNAILRSSNTLPGSIAGTTATGGQYV